MGLYETVNTYDLLNANKRKLGNQEEAMMVQKLLVTHFL